MCAEQHSSHLKECLEEKNNLLEKKENFILSLIQQPTCAEETDEVESSSSNKEKRLQDLEDKLKIREEIAFEKGQTSRARAQEAAEPQRRGQTAGRPPQSDRMGAEEDRQQGANEDNRL